MLEHEMQYVFIMLKTSEILGHNNTIHKLAIKIGI